MQAGRLRTRITIMRRTEGAQNSSGEPAVTWSSLGTFYTRKVEQGGRELFKAQQTWAEATCMYEIRTVPSITFVRTDKIFEGDAGAGEPPIDILGIMDPDEGKGVRLHLVCREYRA